MAKKKTVQDLDPELFKKNPAWFRGAVAIRLVQLMIPRAFSRKLPGRFRKPLHLPDAIISPDWRPGDPAPPGIAVAPGTVFPPGWQPGDPLPPGAYIIAGYGFQEAWTPGDPLPAGFSIDTSVIFPPGWAPGDPLPGGINVPFGVSFPPGWTPGDPLPFGVTVDTAVFFPPGWAPGDPLPDGFEVDTNYWFPEGWIPGDPIPEGLIPWTTLPPGAPKDGILPPNYLGPGAPFFRRAGGAVPATEYSFSTRGEPTNDCILSYDADWPTALAGTGATAVIANDNTAYDISSVRLVTGFYEITRGYFEFDLSSIPSSAVCLSATIEIITYTYYDSWVSLFAGNWTPPLAASDYNGFSGDLLATVRWEFLSLPASGRNKLEFNAAGLLFAASRFGQKAQFCCREHARDVGNSAPTGPSGNRNGGYISQAAPYAYDPLIKITYEA